MIDKKIINSLLECEKYAREYGIEVTMKALSADSVAYIRKALEKQIPIKPDSIYDTDMGVNTYNCPVCGIDVIADYYEWCPACGQALDWGEEE